MFNSKAGLVSLVAEYNCFERDRNVFFLKVWHKVSENASKNQKYHRNESYGGSYNEYLPQAVCNDIDMLVSLPHWPQVLMEPPPNPIPQGYVTPEPDTKYPGFLTLRVPPEVSYMAKSLRNNNQDMPSLTWMLPDTIKYLAAPQC